MYACIHGYDDIVDIFLEDTRVEVQIKDNNGVRTNKKFGICSLIIKFDLY